MFSFHDDIVYFSHCNVSASKSNISLLNIAERSLTSLFARKGTTFPTPQFPKRHESARTCELLRVNYLWMISNVACPTAPRLRFSFL